MGWFSKLKDGLKKSSSKLSDGITNIVKKRKLDEDMLDELEELLISADMGVETASKIITDFGREKFNQDITAEDVKSFLASAIAELIRPFATELDIDSEKNPM